MAAPIDFYFDFSSPYGYLASQKIEALAAKHGRTVDWHPMLLGVVFKQTGTAPLTEIPLKGDYSRRDFARSARFHGIAGFRMPSSFPIATQAPARIVLWAKAQRPGAGRARRARRCTARSSSTDIDISSPDVAAAVAGDARVSTPRRRARRSTIRRSRTR